MQQRLQSQKAQAGVVDWRVTHTTFMNTLLYKQHRGSISNCLKSLNLILKEKTKEDGNLSE